MTDFNSNYESFVVACVLEAMPKAKKEYHSYNAESYAH
jgi:hypothetical protein